MQRNLVMITRELYPRYFPNILKMDLSKYVLQYLWSRGFTNIDYVKHFFDGGVAHDTNPFLFKDMRKAVARIWKAIENNEDILIFGDYDTDGKTSSTVMYQALSMLTKKVTCQLPTRVEGYGLQVDTVIKALDENPNIKLIITVDNGIKAKDSATECKKRGIDLIVTDHHDIDELAFPHDAYAVINPQQNDCDYPELFLSGCGVAYKTVHAVGLMALELNKNLTDLEWNKKRFFDMDFSVLSQTELADFFANQFVDLVGVSIVGDVMPLDSLENRHLLKQGLHLMHTYPSLAIQALCDLQHIDNTKLTANEIVFNVSPQIGVASRLGNPRIAFDFLNAKTEADAIELAQRLIDMNNEKKELQYEHYLLAEKSIKNSAYEKTPIIVAQLEHGKHGLAGLVASNLQDKYARPAIVMTPAVHNKQQTKSRLWVASSRSVKSVNIGRALKEVHDLLPRYGGHAVAAGFSIEEHNIPEFTRRMKNIVLREMPTQTFSAFSVADMEISVADINWNMLNSLKILEPTGSSAVPIMTFLSKQVQTVKGSARLVGKSKNHTKLKVKDGLGNTFPVAWWKSIGFSTDTPPLVDMIYNLVHDTYQGYNRLQLQVVSMQQHVINENNKQKVEHSKYLLGSRKDNNNRKII